MKRRLLPLSRWCVSLDSLSLWTSAAANKHRKFIGLNTSEHKVPLSYLSIYLHFLCCKCKYNKVNAKISIYPLAIHSTSSFNNICAVWCPMCVCVHVFQWWIGEKRLAKSGCHANSVSWLHNAMHPGDGLNLTLLNLTLASLFLSLLSLAHICGCKGQQIEPINLVWGFGASKVAKWVSWGIKVATVTHSQAFFFYSLNNRIVISILHYSKYIVECLFKFSLQNPAPLGCIAFQHFRPVLTAITVITTFLKRLSMWINTLYTGLVWWMADWFCWLSILFCMSLATAPADMLNEACQWAAI